MRHETLVAGGLAGLATFTATSPAHSVGGLPRILGGHRALTDLGLKDFPVRQCVGHSRSTARLESRQAENDPDRCGEGVGSCASNKCCSSAGWCGTGKDFCSAPDCQQNYGPMCDSNQSPRVANPNAADTSGVKRTKFGSVSYDGAGIYRCVNAGDIAITFDDGPSSYTGHLLDRLDAYNAKATFFITGNNLGKGMINDPSTGYPNMIKRMHASGHQIASHTWSHQNSSQTSAEQWREQMVWNEIAINDILGFFPTYMRPPFSICEAQCQSVLSDLGYHIVYFDLDTQGYLEATVEEIQQSKGIVDKALASSSPSTDAWLHVEHDTHYLVVYSLMDYMLQQLSSKGWNMVTVGQCLGDPEKFWYRFVDDDSATGSGSTTTTTKISTDGTCGNGITCRGSPFGDCCSQNSWCGSTLDHCNSATCNPKWGVCGASTGSDSSGTPAATSTPKESVSVDGTCGNGITCRASKFGGCCSQHGYCGWSMAYCGTGCNVDWGVCVI